MNRRLEKSLQKSNKKKEDKAILLSGELGIALNGQKTVEVPNRQGFVFVRLKNNTSELIQAYNSSVSPVYDLPVLVTRKTGNYIVVGRNYDRYSNQWGLAPYLPKHGAQHSFNPELNIGGDIVWVYSQQFMPLLGYPSGTSGSPRLSVAPYIIRDMNGAWKYVGNTGTPDITPYSPTTGSRAAMGLLYLDTVSGNPALLINSGTYMDSSLTGSNQVVDYIPRLNDPNGIPIAGFRLLSGTTQLSWNNIYDVRPFLRVIPTGTGGGSTSLNIQDEGVPLGTAATLNVVGVNADISISGTVARLFITGSTGGGANPPVSGSFVLQDDGQTLGSVLVLNARNNLAASISGSVATLDANVVLEQTDDFTSQINGVVTTFGPTTNTPVASTARLYYNGVRQRYLFNYTISGSYVETLFTPTTGSVLLLDYNESSSTGTPNGLIGIQDEGVPQGNVSTLNFLGVNVSAVVVGTVANITITGSSGNMRTLLATASPSGTNTVTFNSIPSTYVHLEIEWVARSTTASNADELLCEANADTTAANYRTMKLQAFGTNTVAASSGDLTRVGDVAANNSPASSPGSGQVIIPFYAGSVFKKNFIGKWAYRNDASSNQLATGQNGVEWENTAAITRIDIKLASGNFVFGSTINIYGVP